MPKVEYKYRISIVKSSAIGHFRPVIECAFINSMTVAPLQTRFISTNQSGLIHQDSVGEFLMNVNGSLNIRLTRCPTNQGTEPDLENVLFSLLESEKASNGETLYCIKQLQFVDIKYCTFGK